MSKHNDSTKLNGKELNISTLREKLKTRGGKAVWRSLEEIADTEEFQEFAEREFPKETAPWASSFDRREFIKLMAASMALAGLSACRPQFTERIVPYVKAPEDMLPGKPLEYATSLTMEGYAYGLLVESHQGRPTKIEGNPMHPATLGSTDAFLQSLILELYDPDRSQSVMHLNVQSTWEKFIEAVRTRMVSHTINQGEGLRFLTGATTSPSFIFQMESLLQKLPKAKWYVYEPVSRDNVFLGAEIVFGERLQPVYDFTQAEVILSLDSDFLFDGPGRVRYARDFSSRRRVRASNNELMNRLYVIEAGLTITGATADHRLAVKPSHVENLARELAVILGITGVTSSGKVSAKEKKWLEIVARDLGRASKMQSAIIVGDHQTPATHAIACKINAVLGLGSVVHYITPPEAKAGEQLSGINALVNEMRAGSVSSLVIVNGNPVYNAPAELDFAGAMKNVEFIAHLSDRIDETSLLSHWHIPLAYELESWGDARAYDGTASIIQPLIQPLFDGVSPIEFISAVAGISKDGYEIVKEYWFSRFGGDDFEKTWRRYLHDGLVANSAFPKKSVSVTEVPFENFYSSSSGSEIEVSFRPDPSVWDGRYANNVWLQELPKPFNKVTWDNVAIVSPRTAEKFGIKSLGVDWWGSGRHSPVISLKKGGATIEAPVWIQEGYPDDVVTLTLGYGRTNAGERAIHKAEDKIEAIGYNAYKLRTSDSFWTLAGVDIQKTNKNHRLATTQMHHSMVAKDHERRFVISDTIEEFRHHPEEIVHKHQPHHDEVSMYPDREYKGNAWAMVIDLSLCTGCNACVTACQAENNIAVVGKYEVLRGREMHWIRVDSYFEGDLDHVEAHHQPVPCMHCEKAPCEVVCPVAATVHGAEGLNEMVYNRCVGTRYCSNNCPYKVRRFNFKQYSDNKTPLIKLLNNPDVTVRGRGVMEKCSYCVQRINIARKTAKKENREIKDGEVVTACQQACPTKAIIFGNMNDPNSEVSAARKEPHNYGLLPELNTRPRTTYLAKLKNLNPEMAEV